MIKIAVCDDTTQYRDDTVALLHRWSSETDILIAVDQYDNGDSLIQALTHQTYDLIFLDIIMPMFSGIDTCAEIRKENKQTRIIFLSVSPEFGVDAFRVKANGYLLKPLEPEALFQLMDEYVSEQENSGGFLVAKSMSMVRRVPLEKITHLEAQNKHVLIYTSDGNTLTVTTPLHQLLPQLNAPCFYQCHRSYVVNMNYIRIFSKAELSTSDGHTIPVSRNYSKDLQTAYFAFLFGKAGETD